MRDKVVALLSCLALALGFGFTAAAPAQASGTGWVYVVYGPWNCPNGGKVVGIQASNGGLWSTNWDWGDDIIYPNVYLGRSNTLNANLYCRDKDWWKPGMYVYSLYRTFTPTANNETFWL